LDFFTEDSTTTLMVLPYYNSISLWSGHTYSTLLQFGTHSHMHKDVELLQNVEKFALQMITKRWDTEYQELLDMVALPSLETRRLQSSLCMLYKTCTTSTFRQASLDLDLILVRELTGNFW